MPLCYSLVLLQEVYNLKQRVRRKQKSLLELPDGGGKTEQEIEKTKLGTCGMKLLCVTVITEDNWSSRYWNIPRYWSSSPGMRLCNPMCDFAVYYILLCATNMVHELVKNENLQLPFLSFFFFSFLFSPCFSSSFLPFTPSSFFLLPPSPSFSPFVFCGPKEIHGCSKNWTVPYECFLKC